MFTAIEAKIKIKIKYTKKDGNTKIKGSRSQAP